VPKSSAICHLSSAKFKCHLSSVKCQIWHLAPGTWDKFWLEYLAELQIIDEPVIGKLRDEIDQLVRLFSSIKRKMKEKIGR
jgi:hypothetical protein